MRLTVLGCAGSFPSASSPASGYLLQAQGARLLLDLGNGSIVNLQREIDLRLTRSAWMGSSSRTATSIIARTSARSFVIRAYHPRAKFPRLPVLGPGRDRPADRRAVRHQRVGALGGLRLPRAGPATGAGRTLPPFDAAPWPGIRGPRCACGSRLPWTGRVRWPAWPTPGTPD
jgi:hypothetical protein